MTNLMRNGQESPLSLLFEDTCLLAANKPAGQLFQGHTKGLPSALDVQVKTYIRSRKPGSANVYLGIVHRLDRPVSGVVLFGLNSKFTARLASQFQERSVNKIYRAVVEGVLKTDKGELIDELTDENDAVGKWCQLKYEVIGRFNSTTEIKINLGTGRRNQIRKQFAKFGHPIVGDVKFGASSTFPGLTANPLFLPIALHAAEINFLHPKSYEPAAICAVLPDYWKAAFSLKL